MWFCPKFTDAPTPGATTLVTHYDSSRSRYAQLTNPPLDHFRWRGKFEEDFTRLRWTSLNTREGRSLAIKYDSEAGDRTVWVRVPLCTSGQPVALEIKTVAACFRFDSALDRPPRTDALGVLSLATYSGSTRAASLGVVSPRTWSDSTWQYHTMVAYSSGAASTSRYQTGKAPYAST